MNTIPKTFKEVDRPFSKAISIFSKYLLHQRQFRKSGIFLVDEAVAHPRGRNTNRQQGNVSFSRRLTRIILRSGKISKQKSSKSHKVPKVIKES